MKLYKPSFALKVIALSILLSPISTYSQEVFTGVAASRMYEKASVVRSSKHSVLPSYIKLKQGEEIPFGDFQSWVSSAFKMNPALGFKLKSTEKDNLGHLHYRYNQTLNGNVIEHATWIVHTKN
jgi:Zn-dependent metalloprotease